MVKIFPKNLDEFLTSCNYCKDVQLKVLLDIISRSSSSEFGKKHGFDKIKNYNDYISAVKPNNWNNFSPYVELIKQGKENQLFSGSPEYFICTSGTTSTVKMMPESSQGKKIKSLTTQLRFEAILEYAPTIINGKLFPLVNNAVEGYTENNIAYGSASGIALATASKEIQNKVAFPIEILELGYTDELDYLLLRFAVEEDVRIILGNNAGRIEQLFLLAEKKSEQLIKDIDLGTISPKLNIPDNLRKKLLKKIKPNPERASELRIRLRKYGHFLPKVYWPKLEIISCWLAGSVGRYVKTLRPMVAKSVRFFDVGYGATEGKFNIPLEPEKPDGPLSIYSAFYEFKPLNKESFLLAHELKNGELYELFVTTYSGLYRYAIHDIIRVDGFTGTNPHIVFEYKDGEVLNISGEKVAAASLIHVVSDVMGNDLIHWCVLENIAKKRYLFCLEFSNLSDITLQTITDYETKLENAMVKQNLIYPIFRKQKMLNSVEIKIMRNGWKEKLYKDKTRQGQSKVQVKLPLVYHSIPHPEYIIDANR